MGVKAPQPAKPICAHSYTFEVRQHDASGVANNDVLDVTVSIYKHPYLTVNLVRCFRELARKLLGDYLARRDPPLVKLFETVNLIRLKSL